MRYFLCLVLVLCACNAMAVETAGKFGFAVRGGMTRPADARLINQASGVPTRIDTDDGIAINGSILYGLRNPNDNFALELETTYSSIKANYQGVKIADIRSFDSAVGLQYRFDIRPGSKISPYFGLGLDLLMYDMDLVPVVATAAGSDARINTTYGVHSKFGADFFVTNSLAINAEVKGVWGATTDMQGSVDKFARYNPSTITGLLGLRYFIK